MMHMTANIKERLTSEQVLRKATSEGLINQEDTDKVLLFIKQYGTLKKLSKGSINKYYYALKAFLLKIKELGTNIEILTEEQVLKLIEFVQNHDRWSEDTREDYWQRFSHFYAFISKREGPWNSEATKLLVGEDKYVYKIDDNKVEKKGILSPEEVVKLIHTEPNLSYKVFFAVLYEGGLRAGEAFSLLNRDVERENGTGYAVHVRSSKTKKRPVPLLNIAVHHVNKWKELHPEKDNPDAPFFVNTIGEPMKHEATLKHLKKLLKQAKVNSRKVTLHSFRHSRATELAGRGMSEFEMCKLFGWKVGSLMPATYIRESGIDTKKALRRAYGIVDEEEKPETPGKICIQCSHVNPFTAEICDNCNLPLDPKRIEQIKANAEAVKMEELLKKMLMETKADLINEVVKEITAQDKAM
jgi:integrase/ribosomal protein L40E